MFCSTLKASIIQAMDSLTPIDVLDTAVKIGLGALLSGTAAYWLAKLNHDREAEKDRLRRRREMFELVAEQIEKFTHDVLRLYSFKTGVVRCQEASKPISVALRNDIEEVRTDLFRVFGELTSAESKLLLLGEDECQKLLREYGDSVTQFVAVQEATLTRASLEHWRTTILEKRKALFASLSHSYNRRRIDGSEGKTQAL